MILVRYGEIGIKSRRVRNRMEKLLVKNIKNMLDQFGVEYGEIWRDWGRIFVDSGEDALEYISRVFGVVSCSPVSYVSADLEKIRNKVVELAEEKDVRGKKFAVRARRKKEFDVTSREIERIVGRDILEKAGGKVNLSEPDITFYVEVRPPKAFIYTDIVKGVGGLPVGSQDKAILVMDSPYSPLAGWYMMRRGCRLAVAGETGVLKGDSERLVKLSRWCAGHDMEVLCLGDLEESFTYSRKMIDEGSVYAAISGYVISTPEDFEDWLEGTDPSVPLLSPLISFEKEEMESGMRMLESMEVAEEEVERFENAVERGKRIVLRDGKCLTR